MNIKEIPKNARPRERFIELGPESLSDAEMLAIILRSGNRQENVIDMSHRIIAEYGLDTLFSCSITELQKIKGIGIAKALQILSVQELSKRMHATQNQVDVIYSSRDVYDIFANELKGKLQENFYILMLNKRSKVIAKEKISIGTIDAAIIHPREIFRPAIKHACSKIILVHNHPSGDPSPSKEDIEITDKLIKVGEMIGIEVMDHVIIGNEKWWSYFERE